MTESGFWTSLRKKLVPRCYALKLNLRMVAGVPDCWLSGSRDDLWLELKYDKALPRTIDLTNTSRYLSMRQQQWLTDRHHEGRNVAVLLGSPDGHVLYPGISWTEPTDRESFLSDAVKTPAMAQRLIDLVGDLSANEPAGKARVHP